MVHVHGFGISGTYLEPTAALLADRYPTYVPDLPGMGRSMRPSRPLDLPGLAAALISYCDAVGVERATFVGNSLGCPLILEVASSFPDRIERAVLVSPAGGPNNIPVRRALRQMMLDAPREPLSMVPIAVRDYLRFGVLQSWSLFQAMTRYPTLERVASLVMPTLVIAGDRDPLVQVERVGVFAGLPHVDAVQGLRRSRAQLQCTGADRGLDRCSRPRPTVDLAAGLDGHGRADRGDAVATCRTVTDSRPTRTDDPPSRRTRPLP